MLQQLLWGFDWFQAMREWARAARAPAQINRWEADGRKGAPPHAIKQQVLKYYTAQYNLKTLVESGTYHGDMIAALKGNFEKLYSIELSPALYEKARWRFRNNANVHLINGDSGEELEKLVPTLEGPALFWLDGHYSAGPTAHGTLSTPIYNELRHILSASENRHVVVIDDARHFGVERDYPSLQDIKSFVNRTRPDLAIQIDRDSIQIFPRATPPVSNHDMW